MLKFPQTIWKPVLTGATIAAGSLLCAGPAFAQSTPTELADLSFEDLLNLEIADEGEEATGRRWSFHYSYKRLNVGRYQNGTNNLSFDEVLFSPGETRTAQNYPVVPTFIDQEVHAYSAAYAVNDKMSLNIAVPYVSQSTDHISSVPGFPEFILSTEGLGDISVTAAYQKPLSTSKRAFGVIGISLPTGSIDETGDTPRNGTGTLERLPYTMQLGSGTYDLSLSAGLAETVDQFDLGVTASSTIRFGRNDNGYRLGDNVSLCAWTQYSKIWWFQPGVRIGYRYIEEIQGRDESLLVPGPFPFPASITDPGNYGGHKGTAGVSIRTCTDISCKISFAAEAGKPFYQDLNGVQPKERYNISAGASVQF